MTSRELIDFCLNFPDVYEDYPFDAPANLYNSWAVICHRVNKKSFAFIYERGRRLCVNLKCEPSEADFLRGVFEDVTLGYHMNKTHWNTVNLGGDVQEGELQRMVEQSYNLIKPKMKRKKDEKRYIKLDEEMQNE